MNQHVIQRLALGALIAAGVVLTTVRCGDGGNPPVAPRGPDLQASRHDASRAARVTPEAKERSKHALAKGAWAGEVHRLAMSDLIRDRSAWRGARKRGAAGNCAIGWRLAEKYTPLVAQHIGIELSRHTPKMPTDLELKLGCPVGSGRAFERLLAVRNGQFSLFLQEGLPPGVTGAYEQYGPALESAYYGASTPGQLATATYAVVDQAAANGLGQPDLEYLALIAGISVSSAYQWYEYERAGGFGGGYVEDPLSLFRAMNRWGKVGIADLGGAMMGSRGGPWWAVGGGLVASAVTAINTA
jgi:hypothetical protein